MNNKQLIRKMNIEFVHFMCSPFLANESLHIIRVLGGETLRGC